MAEKLSEEEQILEDLTVCPGTGATLTVGSDSYAYWITEVLPKRVFGICRAKSHFDDKHPWEGGTQVVDEFDASKSKTEMYVKRCYGNWWEVLSNGARVTRFSDKWRRFRIGHAYAYRDPSF